MKKKIKTMKDASQINHKLLSFNPEQLLSLLDHFTRTLTNKFTLKKLFLMSTD